MKNSVNRFEKILLSLFFIELAIGGGGRLLEVGPLSIRQIIFILILCTFALRVITQKKFFDSNVNVFISRDNTTLFVYGLIAWFFVSTAVGIMQHHPMDIIIMDLLRVAFIGLYFPLAYYISDTRYKKEWVIEIIKWSALFVALFTIGIDITGKFILKDNFSEFYLWINDVFRDDLFFRPSRGIFYKSHLFVMFGLIIIFHQVLNKKISFVNVANILLCTISIIWSETRGLLLGFLVAVVFIACIDSYIFVRPIKGLLNKFLGAFSKPNVYKIFACISVMVLVPLLFTSMTQARFPDEQVSKTKTSHTIRKTKPKKEADVSVATRVVLFTESKKIILSSPQAFLFGTGYGTQIGDRLTGIEMSFLDIWVEQGLLGVFLWLALPLATFTNFYRYYRLKGNISYDNIALMACLVALLLLTNINPFINNPIGIGFLVFVVAVSRNEWRSVSKNAVNFGSSHLQSKN